MDGMESFNEDTQRAKVQAGFKGGNMFDNPMTPKPMTVVDGVPNETTAMLQGAPVATAPIPDIWNNRRSK